MGQIARLGEVINRLSEFDDRDTIYASEPWSEGSHAMVAREEGAGGSPAIASDTDMKYFLEVRVAREFIDDWHASLDSEPSPSATCQRVIDYAINDA